MTNKPIPEPWLSFLKEIDDSLESEISFHCFGGFAIDLLYDLPRETADLDIMATVVRDRYNELFTLAGRGSALLCSAQKIQGLSGHRRSDRRNTRRLRRASDTNNKDYIQIRPPVRDGTA